MHRRIMKKLMRKSKMRKPCKTKKAASRRSRVKARMFRKGRAKARAKGKGLSPREETMAETKAVVAAKDKDAA